MSACLFTVFFFFFFWLYCITTVTSFIRRSQGWSLRSGRVLDQSQQKCRFFVEIRVCCKFFQLQPKRETSFSSLRDRLEKSFIISPSNWTICAGLRGRSGFRPVPVTAVVLVTSLPCVCSVDRNAEKVNAQLAGHRQISIAAAAEYPHNRGWSACLSLLCYYYYCSEGKG